MDAHIAPDAFITGVIQVEAFEVQILRPISGWVCLTTSRADRDPQAVAFVPRCAFHGTDVATTDVALTLNDVTTRVEVDYGLQREFCKCQWEAWEPSAITNDDKGWEYAFDAKHDFQPWSDSNGSPTAPSADAMPNANQRMWVRRRVYRRVGNVMWEGLIHIPEGLHDLSKWCRSVRIHRPPSTEQLQHESPPISVGTLGRGMRGYSVAETSRQRTHSKAPSIYSSAGTGKHGLINVEHWIKDSDAAKCMQCSKQFGVVTRRHHCRLCGKVFCSHCCAKNEHYGGVRVCVTCFAEDEEYDRMMAEEAADEQARLVELEKELLLVCSPLSDKDDGFHAGNNDSALVKMFVQLEVDCREEIEHQMDNDYAFLTSLGVQELMVLTEISDLQALPSLVQLSESLRVVQFERSLKASSGGGSSVLEASTPAPAPGIKAAITPAVQVTTPSENGTASGMVHLRVTAADGIKLNEGASVRMDVRIGNGSTMKGEWMNYNSKQSVFTAYVMVQSQQEQMQLCLCSRGVGNAITDMLVDMAEKCATCSFDLTALLTKEDLQEALSINEPKQYCGSYSPSEVRNGKGKMLKGSTLKVEWSFDVRPLYATVDFCNDCGRVSRKCTCHADIVEPVLLGASEPVAAPKSTKAPRYHVDVVPTDLEREKSSAAWEKLITCVSERMLLEKHFSVTSIDTEQREEYGKLRNSYFRATNAIYFKAARRKKYPEIEKLLQDIAAKALKSAGGVYLGRWHQHSIVYGPERRLKRARNKLEQRAGLMNAQGPEPIEIRDSTTPAPSKRKPTSEKCCTMM